MRLQRAGEVTCRASPTRLRPAGAVSGHAKEEEEEAVVCYKAMTTFPSNLQGEDGENFFGSSPDREFCNVKCRIILERHEKEAEHQQMLLSASAECTFL